MNLYKNKYRTKTTRLECWDYSENGEYFVTICTKNSKIYFGDVCNEIMGLNDLGNMAAICWQNIPLHFPFVELGAWVVMPNHVHGIIFINNKAKPCRDAINRVSTDGGITGKHNPMGKNTLGEIVRWFKGRTSYEIHKNIKPDFSWQPKFWDHLITKDAVSEKITNYILDNPRKWHEDRNNPENLWM